MDLPPQAAPEGTLCIRCGYSLRGLRIDGNCPECGTPVERTIGALPTTTPDAATCIRCAYSLRGLSPQGVCPECGIPIERSLRGDLLLYSDPEYLRKLLAGARLIFWSALTMVASIVATIILGISGGRDIVRAPAFLLFGAVIAFMIGWWFLTWPDAGQLSKNKGQRPRRIVRFVLIAQVALVALSFVLAFAGRSVAGDIVGLLALVRIPLMVTGFWAGMLYIRWLAPRILDGRAHARAKILLILFPSIIGALILGTIFAVVSASNHGDAFLIPVVLFIGAAIASLVAFIMYCRLFFMLRAGFVNIAAAQREAGTPG